MRPRLPHGWFPTLAIAACALTAFSARAEWSLSGDRLTDDFETDVFPGWQPSDTTEKPVLSGDHYLGPHTQMNLGLLDFIDDLAGEVRLVDIAFDAIDPLTGSPLSAPITVILNGDAYDAALLSTSPPRFGVTAPSHRITFPNYDPSTGCCGDLLIEFKEAQGALFGLDNVIVDWSVRVPEPCAATLALIFAAAVRLPSRRRRTELAALV